MISSAPRLLIGLTIAAILGTGVLLSATAVLVFLRGGKAAAIYIGADSAVLRQTQPRGQPHATCKIVHGSRFAVALAGTVRGKLEVGRGTVLQAFDLFAIARRAAERATPEDVVTAFNDESRPWLDQLARESTTNGAILQLVVAGFAEGTPRIKVMDYMPVRDATGLSVRLASTECPPRCPEIVPFGIGHIREEVLESGSLAFMRATPLPSPLHEATGLLEQQVRATNDPSVIAPPFDVLEITAKGMRWQRCKAECGDGCPR